LQTQVDPIRAATAARVRSVLLGTGGALPERVMTNADLERIVDTSDDWIVQRTGIRERRIAAEGETTADLAVAAAREALGRAGVAAREIDLVIVATSTPDRTFPATAVAVQRGLGIEKGAAFDVQAVCSGFVYALTTADSLLRTGAASRALVIGAETFSRILDWEDRTTCVLFGDGAGAVVLEARLSEGPGGPGVLATRLRSDGRHEDKLYVDGGPSSTGTVGHLRMQGREVFRFAVGAITDVVDEVLREAGVTAADVDWFVPHQANRRIIEASAKKLGIPIERTVVTVERHGNTSAASIPLALAEAGRAGMIGPGDLVLLEAMGGGFTWGAALLRA
jgi:3-oxoacyl-[acyl-carrier-protein] synthase-3